MRVLWVVSHLCLSTGILSIPILLFGWFDRDKKMVGKIMRLWASWMIWSIGIKSQIKGLENLEPDSQYVFMCNHESALDILIGIKYLPYNLVFLAKKELFVIPFFGWALKASGMIRIDRENKEKAKSSVENAINIFKQAKFSTLLYPEGTRSQSGEILPFKKGGFILAIRSKLPIVPLTIIGASSILPSKSLQLAKGDVALFINKPIITINIAEEDKDKILDQCRNIIIENKNKYENKSIQHS